MRASQLASMLADSRRRTLELVADLSDEQMSVPLVAIINPIVWEMGHVAWFQEKWALGHLRGLDSLRPEADSFWDSAAVAHDHRWELPLPSRSATLQYMQDVLDRVLEKLPPGDVSDEEAYFHWLVVMHEDMHGEAFTYTRQTLGYAPPPASEAATEVPDALDPPPAGDAALSGGEFLLGACPTGELVFDNEKWAHPVDVAPFAIARAAVTNSQFAAFVDGGGYRRREFWSEAGWTWRETACAEHPVYWIRDAGGWLRRHYDRIVPLDPHLPIIHVNWYEAEAYCRWAGRRLPTEAEWEMAAAAGKQRFPWGDDAATSGRAFLDARAVGCGPAGALPAGDSPAGCRGLIGNAWEWTASEFRPYPGFVIDPYKEYSQPWMDGNHMVLRGGCWATRSRLIRSTWRNFYKKDRRDVFGGFRTCAL